MRTLWIPLLVAALLAACTVTATEDPMPGSGSTLITLEEGLKLGGCSAGDLHPAITGDEIAVTDERGRVHVLLGHGAEFAHEIALESSGELIQCVVGRWGGDPPAIFAVGVAEGSESDGGRGVLRRIWRVGSDGWNSQVLLDDSALLHAVAVGDVDPDHPGNELVAAGFARRVHLLRRTSAPEEIGELPANAKGLAVGLGGVLVACDDGRLFRFRQAPTGWERVELGAFGTPLARVAADAERVLVSTNDGRLLRWSADRWTTLVAVEDRLRGAVFLDGVAARAAWASSFEAATAGYDGFVRLAGPGLEALTVAGISGRLHHLCLADLPGVGGSALVGCGYTGQVLVVPLED